MNTPIRQALEELVAQCVDYVPIKGIRGTYTNNHKHIREMRRSGIEVDKPIATEWTAQWTICGFESTNAFFKSLEIEKYSEAEFTVWDCKSPTKKGLAEVVHEEVVKSIANDLFWLLDHVDIEFGEIIKAKFMEFASVKVSQ